MTTADTNFMRLALEEAKKGQGRTSPNPCVGAVIVKNGIVVGRGCHRRAGEAHAEVNAIADAGPAAAGGTLYVTLEPCNHTGRTPPCTQAILAAGLVRVVVGMADPNPRVAGGGSAYLRSRGLEVNEGVLEKECRMLNLPFIKHVTTGLPWVVMKAGMSLDGKISYAPGRGGRITGPESRLLVHRLRNTLDAICIGVDTALIDNPSLTTRLPAEIEQRDPLRMVIDTHLRLAPESKIVHQHSEAPLWIFCGPEAPAEAESNLTRAGAMVHRLSTDKDGRVDVRVLLDHLGKRGITSVLVEGGAAVHGSFLKSGLVDEVYLFIAPFFIGGQGTSLIAGPLHQCKGGTARLHTVEARRLDGDVLIHGFVSPCPAPDPGGR